MLRNKYVAIVLVILAIILVGNSIRILTKGESQKIKPLTGPPVEARVQTVPSTIAPPSANNNSINKQTPVPAVQDKKNYIRNSNLRKNFSFDKRLKEIKRDLLNPEELIWGKDPFGENEESLKVGKENNVQFTNVFLSAIITKRNIKMCVINNEVFREGEKKNGIYVSSIGENSVTIITGGKEFTINIFEKKTIPLSDKKVEDGDIK